MIKISLAAARINKKMSQEELAQTMGVCRTTILKWENGRTSPTGKQLQRLCTIFELPMDMIFFG